jgi:cytochrome c biogenesis protein CcmG/thiol:disulfide interchange protein DsbE
MILYLRVILTLFFMLIRLKKLLFLLFLLTISSIGATEVKVENFIFERTEYSGKYLDSTYIILSTDKTTNVKCAVFDQNDKPLRVSEDIATPPLSEVIVLSSDAIVTSVQCWELESSAYEQMLENIMLELAETIQKDESNELPPLVAEGYIFPMIEGRDLFSDEIIKTSEIIPNQHTLVNVWASWCTTCRKEHQMLMDISEGTNLQLIGINYKDTREDAMQYLRTFGNPFDKVIFDPSGDISKELGVYATPETFLINKENSEIVYKHIGELTKEIWDKNFANRSKKVNHTKEQYQVLKSAYLSNVAARVKSNWRYQGAEDDWTCEVYIVQDRDGTVVAADIRNCNVDDSPKAKTFKDSVRRAVYKSSPLPSAPDETVFDRELIFIFSVN